MVEDEENEELAPWDAVTALDFQVELDLGDRAQVIVDFIKSCKNRDLTRMRNYFDAETVFEIEGKEHFWDHINLLVNGSYLEGVDELIIKKGRCEGCSCGEHTHEFYNGDKFCFAFLIPQENRVPIGFKQCWKSSGDDRFPEYDEHLKNK